MDQNDKPHVEVAAERYDMLVRHVLNAPMAGHSITFRLEEETDTHYQFTITCGVCLWWDGWDERKEDWIAT